LPVLDDTTPIWTTCMLLYQAMLPSGHAFTKHCTLVFHISNRYINIQKVLSNIAVDASLVALTEIDTAEAASFALGRSGSHQR
jgi:hypothetical protein